jgi:hypothetical protein
MLDIAGFGRVSLAELRVDGAFHLTMVGVDTDQKGKRKIATADANGKTVP